MRFVEGASKESRDNVLVRRVDDLCKRHPGRSGFMFLPLGVDAIAARLVLAERAETSIDAQYYHVTDDLVSQGFFDALLRAADRGVKIRLLIDDVFTKGKDAGLVGLNSHPHFQIRIFNPFARRRARFVDAITSFSRINRRMHNKSFTVDRTVTIIGGRNIADEYYGAREDACFGDLDVMGIGPIATDVAAMFDMYWNHELAVDLVDFAEIPDDVPGQLTRVRSLLETSRAAISNSQYASAVRQRFLAYLEGGESLFSWATHMLVADSPEKSTRAESIMSPLRSAVLGAQISLLVISPYFVPRRSGIGAIRQLRDRGVKVTIVTNSLAANNQPLVHAGYAPSRKPLLRAGARIFEVRDDARVPGFETTASQATKTTLHTKSFVVDGSKWFIGSFNFDPRSAGINTEMGVIIDSSSLATRAEESFRSALPATTFEVRLNDSGALRWHGVEDGEDIVLKNEPNTTWLQRAILRLVRLLPIRGQL